jgi:hypothetical protein
MRRWEAKIQRYHRSSFDHVNWIEQNGGYDNVTEFRIERRFW